MLRFVAAAMLVIEIWIHAYLAPDHLDEVPYIGVAFVAACVALTIAVLALLVAPRHPSGWVLGAALCAGMAAAFVESRLFGLPDYHEAWTSDDSLGLWSLPPEAVFCWCAVVALRRYAPGQAAEVTPDRLVASA